MCLLRRDFRVTAPVWGCLVLAVVVAFVVSSCAALGGGAPPAPRPTVTCVVLRAFAPSGRLDEVCATLEDLAPFVAEILAAHSDAGAPASEAPRLAVSLASPPIVARRRCASWVEVDGGADVAR